MSIHERDLKAVEKLRTMARETGLDIEKGTLRRTSSRFCLGVEHGDYNGTELFGVGTDRFIWMGYKPNGTDTHRLFSGNFPGDGVVVFRSGEVPEPRSPAAAHTWARFPYGVDFILRREGYPASRGIDAVILGDIPGGGMSRSASLTLNLILSMLDAQGAEVDDPFRIVDMAQAVENDYIGSPCGRLDQVMILFSREEEGTYYNPRTGEVTHIPLGKGAPDFRFVGLDTGTERPGLEKSTYRLRRAECERLVSLLQDAGYVLDCLADIREESLYREIRSRFAESHPDLCDRLKYIYSAQNRFPLMLDAWKSGDIKKVGALFREDGIGLRDDYRISGPELETMCDIARTVDGVYGERMLGGGDKGAAGALVAAGSMEALRAAVETAYPRSRPAYRDRYAVHVFRTVDGVRVFADAL